jgi:aspartyl-tRNA synthetase
MPRTERAWCGDVRPTHAGQPITLYGWVDHRRDHGGLIFVDVRDRSGLVQVAINPETSPAAHAQAAQLRLEYVIRVKGAVARRPANAVNPQLPTGEVEVQAQEITILSRAQPPPFPISERVEIDEKTRLQYRYLDIRRPGMHGNLLLRHRAIKAVRDFMDAEGFVEIETPVMIRSTPEGARDYLVPSRVNPRRFYALAQSPQLYKQLLMVGGIDRYFQVVRCYRDEDLRADRQPEFTQLDVEMSFVTQEDVLDVTERCVAAVWKHLFGVETALPFPRLVFADAMRRFGSDKPDLRYALELIDLTPVFTGTQFRIFQGALAAGGTIRGLCIPQGSKHFGRKEVEGTLTETVRTYRAKGLAYWVAEGETFQSPISQHFSSGELAALREVTGAQPGDLVVAVADQEAVALEAVGQLRREVATQLGLAARDQHEWVWITEFPMFENNVEEHRLEARHHPFTAPLPDDLALLEREPGRARAQAYDLVLNGTEVAGGSIRISDLELQRRVFGLIGLNPEAARQKFGFLLEAFEYGVPPHGGIAWGLDRFVMLAAGEDSIREVIAFPKTQQAQELMSGAPAEVDPRQLRELGLELRVRPKEQP